MYRWINEEFSRTKAASLSIGIVLAAAWIEHLFGRIWTCACGTVKFWTGAVVSSENSQQLFDPYTFTHITHGIGLYFLLWFFFRKMPARKRFVFAVLLEALWEVLENTPLIIDRYRAVTFSLNYYGDSILNSTGDILAAMLGIYIASKLPWRWSLAFVLALELGLLFFIHDSLLLNIIMLVYPIKVIQLWQQGFSNP